MKKCLLFLMTIACISAYTNADMMAELTKRDRKNPIRISGARACVLYAKDGYLHTEYWEDGFGVPTIVAYQINEDVIKLIIRVKTWDFAFSLYDRFFESDGIDEFTVEVHNYYLVELAYANDKLETYCNRIREINTNGFLYNEAVISDNINKVSSFHTTYPHLKTDLTKGMKVKIAALINERTNTLSENSGSFETYDYYYYILVDGEQVRINGWLLDFGNNIEYRSKILILKSGNIPQKTPPDDALNYFGTWRYNGTGGMGFDEYRRVITITITADKFHYHFRRYKTEYEYTLTDLTWTKIIRPDEDFTSYVEILNDDYKGASGYIITGTVVNKTGDLPKKSAMTEYVYIKSDSVTRMFWYNSDVTNYILVRQKALEKVTVKTLEDTQQCLLPFFL